MRLPFLSLAIAFAPITAYAVTECPYEDNTPWFATVPRQVVSPVRIFPYHSEKDHLISFCYLDATPYDSDGLNMQVRVYYNSVGKKPGSGQSVIVPYKQCTVFEANYFSVIVGVQHLMMYDATASGCFQEKD